MYVSKVKNYKVYNPKSLLRRINFEVFIVFLGYEKEK